MMNHMESSLESSPQRLYNSSCTTAVPSPQFSSQNADITIPNPFVHVLRFTPYDKIRIAVLTLTVLPIRLVIGVLLLVVAWGLAGIGLSGLDEDDLTNKPLTGWRRRLRSATCLVVRVVFVMCGFHWLSVKGRQASAKEAPILAIAPHSSFFDALPVIAMDGPSIVAKIEAKQAPFFGKLMNFTQPVYVSRDDANSRQNTIKEMQRRSHSEDEWNQIAIFPEGTCTNRTSLIAFKLGAFYPGVPIQPVCIKYPNRFDTVTWTWYGVKALQLLWLSVCQFHLRCEVEFLPVYTPSDEEIKNPRLFASNVRQKMAVALGLPVSDYTYDCRGKEENKAKDSPPHDNKEHINGQMSNGVAYVPGCSAGMSDGEGQQENGSTEESKTMVFASEVTSSIATVIDGHINKPKSE